MFYKNVCRIKFSGNMVKDPFYGSPSLRPEDNYFGSNMIVHFNFQSIKFEYSRSTLFQNLIIGLI